MRNEEQLAEILTDSNENQTAEHLSRYNGNESALRFLSTAIIIIGVITALVVFGVYGIIEKGYNRYDVNWIGVISAITILLSSIISGVVLNMFSDISANIRKIADK